MSLAYRQRTKPPVSRKRLEAYHCHSLRLLIDTRRFRSSQHCQHLSFHPLQVHHSLELLLLWRHSNNEPRTKHEHRRRTAQTQDSSLASSDCVITATFVSCSVCTRYIYTAVQKCHLTPKHAWYLCPFNLQCNRNSATSRQTDHSKLQLNLHYFIRIRPTITGIFRALNSWVFSDLWSS